jgi:hypothetical protein
VYVSNNPVLQDDPDGQIWNFVAGAGAGVLEYTVKVAVNNALEGKPVSSVFEGWDAGEAALSAAKGAIVYNPGIALGVGTVALASGAIDAATSVYRQLRDTGEVNVAQAAAEGIFGGATSFALGKMLPYPAAGVRGVRPTGKYWQTALFGAHAKREYLKAVWSGVTKAPIKHKFKAHLWPDPVYATHLNDVYGVSPSAGSLPEQLQITGAGGGGGGAAGGGMGDPPSGGK